eukprot:11406959-Alexandrium_andersonii.AAC.1
MARPTRSQTSSEETSRGRRDRPATWARTGTLRTEAAALRGCAPSWPSGSHRRTSSADRPRRC